MDRNVKRGRSEVETVETWPCQHVFILKALQGRDLFTHKSTKNSMWVPWILALWFGWRHNLSRIPFCSPGKLFCYSSLSPPTILPSLHSTVTCPLLSDLFWLLGEFSQLIMAHFGESRNNVLILHSCSHICISMSWIGRCWVLQLGILPFPTTSCFSSGFNLCGLENASRLWGLPKTNNN